MAKTYAMLINGEVSAAAAGFTVTNPSTLEELAQCPSASQEQVDAAVAAAVAAQPAWAAMPLEGRKKLVLEAADVLEKNIEELGKLLSCEQGKPYTKAGPTGEVAWAVGLLRRVANEVDLEPITVSKTTKVYRRPVGVVVGLTPWNFPVFCGASKWVPSLLFGNTFVHKPSPFTPLTNLRIGELLKDVFPKGVYNVVAGDDKAAFNVGGHLSQHPLVNMVSFTGSVPTGKKVMAACSVNGMRRCNIEAGGNDAAIVLPDSDPATTAEGVFAGAFNNSGQICCAIKRAYVHEKIYDEVVEGLVRCCKKAKFGDGLNPETEYGPLNNKMQYDKVMGIIEDTKQVSGATIVTGGKRFDGEAYKGYFIEPTIVRDVQEGCRLVDEEQFGPVLPVIKYSDVDDAVRRANDSQFGLGGSVWSSDEGKAAEIASRLQAGTVWINTHTDLTGGPFGGFKESGIGREFGMADVGTFTEVQTMFVKP